MLKFKEEKSSQDWFPIENIYENGMIFYKNYFIKILKIYPINYDLKSNLEKESILNSYKNFLKICDFDLQILIKSKKEDISKVISKLKNVNETNIKIKELQEEYIKYISKINDEKKSSSKNFYIIIRKKIDSSNDNRENIVNQENKSIEYLNNCYFKIRESLTKCGNQVVEIDSKTEVTNIVKTFIN